METGYSKWRKLDNAALAFPLVTDKNDTRVFRFYCQLKEKVNSEILQQALDQTMEKYPLFQAVLRKGLFWFYLERRDIHAIVKKEKSAFFRLIHHHISLGKTRLTNEIYLLYSITNLSLLQAFLTNILK